MDHFGGQKKDLRSAFTVLEDTFIKDPTKN